MFGGFFLHTLCNSHLALFFNVHSVYQICSPILFVVSHKCRWLMVTEIKTQVTITGIETHYTSIHFPGSQSSNIYHTSDFIFIL